MWLLPVLFIAGWGVFCLIAAQVDPQHATAASIWGLALIAGVWALTTNWIKR